MLGQRWHSNKTQSQCSSFTVGKKTEDIYSVSSNYTGLSRQCGHIGIQIRSPQGCPIM